MLYNHTQNQIKLLFLPFFMGKAACTFSKFLELPCLFYKP
ncbi:hypothetical protein HMPREF0476_2044 [Kingella kingae ATCC 23330]|uniref:Uncharacterized protein n=1 Tax=Kingella kingae ATCC 23330 TaxID=887327 RepID=F5SA11_KINKI|nr:hypothetical protein HMPREF0476_2044 [Kingella kingae ATCC 23330]